MKIGWCATNQGGGRVVPPDSTKGSLPCRDGRNNQWIGCKPATILQLVDFGTNIRPRWGRRLATVGGVSIHIAPRWGEGGNPQHLQSLIDNCGFWSAVGGVSIHIAPRWGEDGVGNPISPGQHGKVGSEKWEVGKKRPMPRRTDRRKAAPQSPLAPFAKPRALAGWQAAAAFFLHPKAGFRHLEQCGDSSNKLKPST